MYDFLLPCSERFTSSHFFLRSSWLHEFCFAATAANLPAEPSQLTPWLALHKQFDPFPCQISTLAYLSVSVLSIWCWVLCGSFHLCQACARHQSDFSLSTGWWVFHANFLKILGTLLEVIPLPCEVLHIFVFFVFSSMATFTQRWFFKYRNKNSFSWGPNSCRWWLRSNFWRKYFF